MTSREKIIVALMCLTILYGAYELFGNKNGSGRHTPPKVSGKGEMQSFMAEITGKLVKEKVSDEYKYMISQAGSRWTKDPFILSTLALSGKKAAVPVAVTEKNDAVPTDAFVYTGFLALGDKKLAIINGREYTTGEKLSRSGFFLKQILPHRVLIGTVNGAETIEVPLYESKTDGFEPF